MKMSPNRYSTSIWKIARTTDETENIQLNLSDEALQHLANKGYSPKYGARPIAGVIRTYIKKSVSRLIVSEQIRPGDNIVINYRNGELIWEQC